MNYAKINKIDVANGPGVRVSLFVSGCTHHCKECFNPETWDFAYGEPFGAAVQEELLQALAPPQIAGLTLLGGEPMAAPDCGADPFGGGADGAREPEGFTALFGKGKGALSPEDDLVLYRIFI